tara:strand:- start:33 stop:1463 length:1431 start_codon:yes stop_codon:yes gene_type:complete
MANQNTETVNLQVKSNIGEVAKETGTLASEFKFMGVSLKSVTDGVRSMGRVAVRSFSSIKAAIASTGIGLFVVAIGSLAQYFKDSEEGASKFKQITTQLGVALGNVTDIISDAGKALFNLITGNFDAFKESLKEVTEGVANFGKTTKEEMKVANQLEKDRLALQKFEREAIVEKARTEKDIMELRLKARDIEKFSNEERLEFMRTANRLADEQLQKDLHVANEKLRFQQVENSFSKSTKENLDAEANLQAQVFQIERSNFSERKRMKSEEQAIVRAVAAEQKKIRDDEAAADKKARDEKAKADKKAADDAIKEAKRVADEKIAITKAEESFKKKTIELGFGAAAAMAGENAALSKGVAAAQTIYQTQQGIMAALGATSVGDKLLPYPVRLANAIATGVMGAAALAKIMSTNPTQGGGGGGSSTVSGAASPAPQMTSGQFTLGGDVMQPEPVQAFVVTDDMTNSQNKLANIRRRATI